ncbi:hypothetical protein HMPREF2887_04140 [Streptococcus sp. HMSC071H03]|uniref:DUF4393 domain-containing protein n=2 Tax=Streptococcus anginosus TaxID=1328 RepID=A0AAP6BQ66_STRAP|nr:MULTISPECIES: DUF4393 domain-containing protein [Streptococcus]MDX5040561.1 DUF4393 domain-containing protein [Streptococcus anginosus]OFR42151.1 hypothetical protein HMPREF2887_04140 [Streptococcus sp. HMSC071H03]
MADLLPTILTAFATTMATKGAEAPANTFNEAWKYVFGSLDSFLLRKNEKRKYDNEKYIESLTEKVEQIPVENIQEPKMSILGPALEASKFYIEEEDIREIFASLLAASFDSSKSSLLHHSFVEIIKQLSPLDARNLKFIAQRKRCPVAKYLLEFETGGRSPLKPLIFIPHDGEIESSLDNSMFDFDRNASSITNLERLGLIKVDFTTWLSKEEKYTLLESNPLVTAYKTSYINAKNNEKLHVEKGIIDITPLGEDFYNVCL